MLTVLREAEAMVRAQVAPIGYEMFVSDLENKLAARVRAVNAYDVHPKLVVTHGESIYDEILGQAKEAGADLIIVGSHRPAMKDYLLGTNAGRVVRHASCSVLIARERWVDWAADIHLQPERRSVAEALDNLVPTRVCVPYSHLFFV